MIVSGYGPPLIPGDNSHANLGTAQRWRAAVYLGLISSTFSTVVSQLSAARIGRDAAVDWMSVAAIPARDWALTADPSIGPIAIGIAFHQWADFSWALVFFGVLGKWTAKLGPASLAIAAVPWAILTSAFEWLILVPLFPFWQPIFTLQQPYWIGFLVHLSSASMYPLFAWLRRSPSQRDAFAGRTFLRVWSLGAICGILLLEAAALFAAYDRELPWAGRNPSVDQTFIRHMSTHHEQGILLASIAAERAGDAHLGALSKLMVANQRGESRILAHWWASWFNEPMKICSAEERASMPGLLDTADVAKLRSTEAPSFDRLFVELMTRHHKGAVAMADSQIREGSDPRLRIMAHAIRHGQQGEIALMHGLDGAPAVSLALRNMFADNFNLVPELGAIRGGALPGGVADGFVRRR
jgi:uncharacterized protein (DUF305 family)